MTSIKHILAILVISIMAMSILAAAASADSVKIKTDHRSYKGGEVINITIKNTKDYPVVFEKLYLINKTNAIVTTRWACDEEDDDPDDEACIIQPHSKLVIQYPTYDFLPTGKYRLVFVYPHDDHTHTKKFKLECTSMCDRYN